MGRVAKGYVTLRRTISAAFAATALAAVLPAAAEATTSCEYDGAAEVVNVRMAADNDSAILKVIGGAIDIRESGGLLSCSGGSPTTANSDAVNVFDESGSGRTFLSIGTPQAFAAGAVAINYAPGGGEDAVLLFGQDLPSLIIAGINGINTDGAAGKDVNFFGTPERIELFGGSGNDTLSARGTGGTGGVLSGPFVQLGGGSGNDTLEGSEAGDLIEGGLGDDTMRGFGGEDALIGDDLAEAGDDVYDGGAGFDHVSYPLVLGGVSVDLAVEGPQQTGDGEDSFAAVEGVIGSSFDDTILGTEAANVIKAGGGDDTVDGRGGDDLLSGSTGTDTLTYADAPAGVVVDLGAGTVSGGGGKDSLGLDDFENLIGSPFADTLTGSEAANRIVGLGGLDTVRALGGADRVEVRDGGPDVASCGSEVDSALADRLSLDTVAPDCEVIDALPEPPGENPGGGGGGAGAGTGAGGGARGGGGPGSKDTSVLFSLRAARRQPLLAQGAIVLKLRCPQEACKVSASAAGRVPAAGSTARELRVKPARAKLLAGTTKTVKLHLRRGQLARIGGALATGKRPKLRITASATDTAGNVANAHLTVTARR